jgi:transposase-like protein/predicted RNA-binding Zn-ribbon protein involved in translation (DUF1610 family)
MRIRLSVPEVKPLPEGRPSKCPWCGRQVTHRTQVHPSRRFLDLKLSSAATVRFSCPACGKTFHHYPQGVTRKQQSARLVVFATLLYSLGLSTDATAKVLEILGVKISKSTVWRDAQEVGLGLRRQNHRSHWGEVRAIGLDETVFKVKGQQVVVGFVTNAQTGDILGVDILVDRTASGFVKWIRRYARRVGAQVAVTDDLSTYRPALEELGLQHQVCLTHVRRNVARRLREIAGHDGAKERLRQIVRELPEEGGEQLLELALEYRDIEPRLYSLALQLSDRWQHLTLTNRLAGVPGTNNVSERAIAPSKIRYRSMRGLKSYRGLLNLLALTKDLYGQAQETHLAQALAA